MLQKVIIDPLVLFLRWKRRLLVERQLQDSISAFGDGVPKLILSVVSLLVVHLWDQT